MVLGLPGRDEKIEQYKAYLRNLGQAGIRYTTYAHMANIKMSPYYATGRGVTRGASTRLFDWEAAKKLPLSHGRVYSEDRNLANVHNLYPCCHACSGKGRCKDWAASG